MILRTIFTTTALSTSAILGVVAEPVVAETPRSASDTVIVTATRVETALSDTPAPVSVVTQEDFAHRQVLDFKDALERLPNVEFFGGPRPSGEMPSVRGATGRQLLILVDGARQSSSPTLATPLYLEPAFLTRAELLRGASSVLYGPGAIGGVMTFSTVSPSDVLKDGDVFGADAHLDYHSASQAYRGVGKVYGRSGAFDALAGVSYREWGAIRQGGGATLKPSDGSATSALVKGGWDISGRLRVQLSHEYYDTEDFRPNNPQADNSFPFMQNNWAIQNLTVLSLKGVSQENVEDTSVSVYRSLLETGADANSTVTPALTASSNELETIGASATRSFAFRTGPVGHRLTLGGDIFQDDYAGLSNGQPDTVSPDGKQTASGAFLRDEIILTKWLSVTPAIRYDSFKTSVASGVAPDTSDSESSPQVTMTLRPTSGWMVYVAYGEAYRAPSVGEMFQSLTSSTAFANFRPNPNLAPENATDKNLGVSWAPPHPIGGADISIRADYFDQDVDNLIVSTVVGTYQHPTLGRRPIQQYQNVSRANREGFEVAANVAVGSFEVSGGYGQVRVIDRDTKANLFSPPDKWTLDLAYRVTPNLGLRWESVWVEAQDYDSTVIRRRPSYDIHDAFISWSPAGQSWKVDFGVTNLFDERYLVYKQSTAYPTTFEQGRSYRIGLGARF